MKEHYAKEHFSEAAVFFILSLFASGGIFYLHFFRPEIYVRLITEDQGGEYGTFVFFALGGILLLILSFRQQAASRKCLWTLGGVFALVIAAEEISWGQRILHFPIPQFLRQLNSQGEFNLHNIDLLDELNREGLHHGVGLMILGWSLFSGLVSLISSAGGRKVEEFGLPLIPPRLLPLFLLVPFFLLWRPLVKADEIGELFLGAAVAAWAIHLFLRYGRPPSSRRKSGALFIIGFLGFTSILAAVMTAMFPGPLKMRLNQAAERDYPKRGLYEQAEKLYAYIYENPEYLLPQTHINHGKMLMERGKEEHGVLVLTAALDHLEGPAAGEDEVDFLLHRGKIHSLLGQAEHAEKDFRLALEIEDALVRSAKDPDQKAEGLWALARIHAAAGRLQEAAEKARQARELAVSEQLRGKVERWMTSRNEPSL